MFRRDMVGRRCAGWVGLVGLVGAVLVYCCGGSGKGWALCILRVYVCVCTCMKGVGCERVESSSSFIHAYIWNLCTVDVRKHHIVTIFSLGLPFFVGVAKSAFFLISATHVHNATSRTNPCCAPASFGSSTPRRLVCSNAPRTSCDGRHHPPSRCILFSICWAGRKIGGIIPLIPWTMR